MKSVRIRGGEGKKKDRIRIFRNRSGEYYYAPTPEKRTDKFIMPISADSAFETVRKLNSKNK
jgi:hypothetical protein